MNAVHCPRCGYDITGTVSMQCPECGFRLRGWSSNLDDAPGWPQYVRACKRTGLLLLALLAVDFLCGLIMAADPSGGAFAAVTGTVLSVFASAIGGGVFVGLAAFKSYRGRASVGGTGAAVVGFGAAIGVAFLHVLLLIGIIPLAAAYV